LLYFTDKTNVFLLSSISLLVVALLTFYGARILYGKSAGTGRVSRFIRDIYGAFSRISLFTLIVYSLLILLTQLLAGFSLVVLCFFLDTKISLWQAVVANSAAFFLGSLSMIPMGLGVREGSMLFYLSHFGVSSEVGIAIVAIQRLLSTGLSLVLGTIFGAVLGLRNMGKNAG
jgi:uncharacterized protein (TIRG00374 family)